MPTGLFSTYRQGENRVTSTFMAVLERLSLSNIDRVLQAILNESSFQLVQFENQVVGKHSVPDARISAASPVWFETKTTRNAIRSCAQIQDHLDSLANDERLLLLTPDDTIPSEVAVIDDQRLAWSNFRTLSEAIKSILEDENDPPTEREAFLLREFISLIEQEGLITNGASWTRE